jgi:ribose transport system permease protein
MSDFRRRGISFGLDRFSGLYLWAAFIVIFGFWQPHLFLTMSTVHSIASQQSVVAMLAIGVLIPLSAGAYDLSVGAVINLSAILAISLQTGQHWGMWEAIVLAVAVSVFVGVVNGFFVVVLKVNSFIATLGMATVITAIQTIVSNDNQPLPPTAHAWSEFTQQTVFGFQVIFLYLIALALIVWWALDHTPMGRYIYAIGGNADAARLSGVRVGMWTWVTLIASSTICGIAGVLYGSLSGPSLTFGQALLLPAFAAAFLGATQLKPGKFNLWGTMIAVFVLATGVQGLGYVTGVVWLNDMFNGVALLGAVSFAVWRQRNVQSRRRSVANRRPDADDEPPDETQAQAKDANDNGAAVGITATEMP